MYNKASSSELNAVIISKQQASLEYIRYIRNMELLLSGTGNRIKKRQRKQVNSALTAAKIGEYAKGIMNEPMNLTRDQTYIEHQVNGKLRGNLGNEDNINMLIQV